jgi:hypothetical protein
MSRIDPIFIGGLMKSGTTLLRVLLGKHPRLFAGLETHWFSPDFRDCWEDPTAHRIAVVLKLFDIEADEYIKLRDRAHNGVSFFQELMWYCTRRASKERWVEKSPANVAHLRTIRERWGDVPVIHVIRDPRDVFASWKKNGKYNLERYLSDLRDIESEVDELLGKRTASYMEVRYADLVRETERTMRSVLDFIGEAWVDGIDRHDGQWGDFEKVLAATGTESATLRSIGRPIFRDSIGQWTNILSREEVELITVKTATYAARTGCLDA